MINILIRTCNRPNYFKGLYKSITSQTYKQIRQIVSYDNKRDLGYIPNDWDSFLMKRPDKSIGTFPYNLYENKLMEQVTKGWVMFLDDDDQFIDKDSLSTIASHAKTKNDLLLWRVQIHNRIVPENNNWEKLPVKRCHISGIGFMFHKKYIKFGQWNANKGSDYRVIYNLTQKIPNIIWIDKVLTSLQQRGNGKRVQGMGKRIDK